MANSKLRLVTDGDEGKKEKKPTQQTVLWIGSVFILILSAVTFVFVPSMVGSMSSGTPIFGSVAGTLVELAPGSLFVNMVRNEQSRQRGSSQGNDYNVFKNAFDATVLNLLFTKAVKDSGYLVPDMQISRELMPYFRDETGTYSQRLFRDTPASNKIAMQKQIAAGLVAQRYADDFFGTYTYSYEDMYPGLISGGSSAPPEAEGRSLFGKKTASVETAFWQQAGETRRSFELATFQLADYPRTEAAAFGNEQPELFAKYDFSVITVATEDAAKKLLRQLTNNEVLFADAVTSLSVKYYSGDDGKLSSGNQYRYQLNSIIVNQDDIASLIALEPDALSGVVQTLNGYSVFRMDSAPIPADFSHDDIIDVVHNYVKQNERGRVEDYYVNIAKDFAVAADRDGFTDAAKSFGATATDLAAFPLNYGNSPLLDYMSSLPTGAERDANFLKTAFSLQPKEISGPLVVGESVVVLKLGEVTTKTGETGDSNDTGADAGARKYRAYAYNFDQQATQAAFLKDPRVKNNFDTAYYKYTSGSN